MMLLLIAPLETTFSSNDYLLGQITFLFEIEVNKKRTTIQGEDIIYTKMRLFRTQAAVLVLLIAMLACSIPPYYVPVPTVPSPYDIYVATTGNDANTCRTAALACRTIAGGVDKAVAGSTIIIGAGTFTEARPVQLINPMNFRGAGQTSTIISSRVNRVFYILSAGGHPAEVHMQDLTLANLTVRDSSAIVNQTGTLIMSRVTIRNNALTGLSNFGTAMLTDCEISDNGGQGIYSTAALQVTNSIFRRNANGAITSTGIAVIQDSTFEQNARDTIVNAKDGDHPGTMEINFSLVSNNTGTGITNIGGHLRISSSAINTNTGNGLLNQDGVLILSNSEVAHNQGRGIETDDLSAPRNASAEITQTSFIMNAENGLYLSDGVARLTNVTMSGNHSGLQVAHGNLTLAYSTVAYNALWGVRLDNADASAVLQNSIVALNVSSSDCITNSGARITQDSTSLACNPALTNLRLRLGPLTLDDGTQLHQLQSGSPAIDTASGECPSVDQRGYRRPYDGNGDGRSICDVGAYEFGSGLHLEAGTPDILEIAPSETPTFAMTPTPGTIILLLDKNANCRHGPGSVYDVATSYLAGQTLQVDGRNEMAPWWWQVAMPNSRQHCWISSAAGTLNGDSNALPVLVAPPTPTVTAKPNGPVDFDHDGYPANQDCDDKNAKIHPGVPETADDKVDSNCNGDDDK